MAGSGAGFAGSVLGRAFVFKWPFFVLERISLFLSRAGGGLWFGFRIARPFGLPGCVSFSRAAAELDRRATRRGTRQAVADFPRLNETQPAGAGRTPNHRPPPALALRLTGRNSICVVVHGLGSVQAGDHGDFASVAHGTRSSMRIAFVFIATI